MAAGKEESFITPTAVIKQINLLENSLDVKLFERTHGVGSKETPEAFSADLLQGLSSLKMEK